MRIIALLAVACSTLSAATEVPAPITVEEIATPAAAGSLGGSFTRGPDGAIWLSWVEPGAGAIAAGGHHAKPKQADAKPAVANTLRIARLDPATGQWEQPQTILAHPTVPLSSADHPQVVVDGQGRLYAHWVDGAGGARVSHSDDNAASWSAPAVWTHASDLVEKFSFARMADGRVLATWLDGRARAGGKPQQLYTRHLGDSEASDRLIDASVCDCCQTALAPLLDGGALLAYRGRTPDERRDIRVARLRTGAWLEPRDLATDGWKIAACPINGPRLAVDRSRAAATWFTAAEAKPRVLVSYSADAGASWLTPLRIDRGEPVGHGDVALLQDGALLALWIERDGSLWLRRITPEFTLAESVELAPAGAAATRGFPRLMLREDYAGGRSAAEALVVFTRHAAPAGVRTLRVRVPEGDLLNQERACDCAPSAAQLRSLPVRGTILRRDAASGTVRVRHSEVPGVLPAGARDFRASTELAAAAVAGREFLGRIEQNRSAEGPDWTLIEVRLLGES